MNAEDRLGELKARQNIIDRQVIEYSLTLLKPFYEERRAALKKIPQFWAVVVGESDALNPYITFEDSRALEALKDFYIEWDSKDSRNFTLIFEFGANDLFGAQQIKKKCEWHDLNDEDGYYTSPDCLKLQCSEDSLFRFFAYTADGDTRDENTAIAQILASEVYPNALAIYEAAQDEPDVEEEYDISD